MSIELRVFLFSSLFTFLAYNFFSEFFINNYFNQFLLFLVPLIWPGIAHGSLDLLIAKKKQLIGSIKTTFSFIFFYLLLAILILLFWFTKPSIALSFFLLISIIHFGTSDTKNHTNKNIYLIEVSIRGLMPISIPIFIYPNEVNFLFSKLFINDNFFYQLAYLNQYIFFLLIFLVIMFFFFSYNVQNKNKLKFSYFEISTIFLCFVCFEPLISFCLYFCFIHSLRHLLEEKKNLDLSNKELILNSIPITIITLLGMIFCYFLIDFDDNYFKFVPILFISLASLTVPHMFIVSWSKVTYNKD